MSYKGYLAPYKRVNTGPVIRTAEILEAAASILKSIYEGVKPDFKNISEHIRVKAYDLLRFERFISRTKEGFKANVGLDKAEWFLERARKLRR